MKSYLNSPAVDAYLKDKVQFLRDEGSELSESLLKETVLDICWALQVAREQRPSADRMSELFRIAKAKGSGSPALRKGKAARALFSELKTYSPRKMKHLKLHHLKKERLGQIFTQLGEDAAPVREEVLQHATEFDQVLQKSCKDLPNSETAPLAAKMLKDWSSWEAFDLQLNTAWKNSKPISQMAAATKKVSHVPTSDRVTASKGGWPTWAKILVVIAALALLGIVFLMKHNSQNRAEWAEQELGTSPATLERETPAPELQAKAMAVAPKELIAGKEAFQEGNYPAAIQSFSALINEGQSLEAA
ncbi:MAG: hypothetical protein AAGI38_23145, partial [Bacteroidota bacterium]